MTSPSQQQIDAALRACETREELEQLVQELERAFRFSKARANDILIERNAITPRDMQKDKTYTIETTCRGCNDTFTHVRYNASEGCFRSVVDYEESSGFVLCKGESVYVDGVMPPSRPLRTDKQFARWCATRKRERVEVTDYRIYDPTVLIR